MQGPFNAALAQATGGAVMVLDQSVNPFKRIWCLFEVSRLRDLQRPFELICRAESSKEADKFSIWAEVADSGVRQGICGSGAESFFRGVISRHGIDDLDSACFADFNLHMRSLLSTSLLQIALASSDFKSAARCCAHGASPNEQQLDKLWANFDSERDRGNWLDQMLTQTVLNGNASLLHLLLKLGADAGHSLSDDHMTNLLGLGARNGHESVVKLLLEHGADASAARFYHGVTALMDAALWGHEPVAKLLLEHGADAGAADNKGMTALMKAAADGHKSVVKMLLQHGADASAADNKGMTALMLAAQDGHEIVVKLLLEHGADANAARIYGVTALMDAAENGHEPVVKLLLAKGSDASAAANAGAALMLAHQGGHEPVVKLLLEHGADDNNDGAEVLMLLARHGRDCPAPMPATSLLHILCSE